MAVYPPSGRAEPPSLVLLLLAVSGTSPRRGVALLLAGALLLGLPCVLEDTADTAAENRESLNIVLLMFFHKGVVAAPPRLDTRHLRCLTSELEDS